MKTRKDHKFVIGVVGAWWLANVIAPAKALQYGRAAQRDERSGFPYTAAMEWRNAAELVAFNPRAAEYCWRQWERIMHLPRRLAGPGRVSQSLALRSEAPLLETDLRYSGLLDRAQAA